MVLDKNRHYMESYSPTGLRYIQDGKEYNPNGSPIEKVAEKEKKKPVEVEPEPEVVKHVPAEPLPVVEQSPVVDEVEPIPEIVPEHRDLLLIERMGIYDKDDPGYLTRADIIQALRDLGEKPSFRLNRETLYEQLKEKMDGMESE